MFIDNKQICKTKENQLNEKCSMKSVVLQVAGITESLGVMSKSASIAKGTEDVKRLQNVIKLISEKEFNFY